MDDNKSANSKRIAKNTLLLYARTFVTMTIALYTSRVVLRTLGVEDYGIYNIVGGFVGMFSLISSTLTASTQRFITFELGKKDGHPNEVFSSALSIHIAIALLIIILAETFGLWFLNVKMNIPVERYGAANWVFQFSVITFVVNLISVPYNAAIVAHEKMSAFAYISLLETSLKLGIVYVLPCLSFDRLIVYGFLMLLVALLVRYIYGAYCAKHFSETKFTIVKDKSYYRRLLGFTGWNIIGSSSGVLSSYGVNVLMNLFFGVTVNAARGIASQLDNAVNQFVGNFTMAINPQITKSYASNEKEYMMSLIMRGAKYSYFLLFIMALPILLEADTLLRLWLGEYPEFSVSFLRLSLIYMLLQSLSNTLYTAMLATGNIRNYQIVVGGLALLAFPLAYLFFYLGLDPNFGYYATIIVSILCLAARLYMLRGMIELSIQRYIKEVLFRVVVVTVVATLLPLWLHCVMNASLFRFLFVAVTSVILSGVTVLFVGITSSERLYIFNMIRNRIHGKKK